MLNVVSETLCNGLTVLYLRLPHVHSVSLSFMARSGPRYESAKTNGVSHLLEHLLLRGTRGHPDSLSFHIAVESLGGEINGLTQRDATTIHMTVPPRRAAEALALLGEVCTEPLLAGLDVERSVVIEEILDTKDADGRELDLDTLSRRVLWGDHPMAMPVTGELSNVESFTEDDCRAQFLKTFSGRNGVLCVAGPINVEDLSSVVQGAFRAMPEGHRVLESGAPCTPWRPPIHVQETEDSQVSVLLTYPAPHENEPDFGALLLMRRILDDGFAARLRQAICEQRGLAYSLAVTVDAYGDIGALDLEASCSPQKVVAVTEQMLSTLETLCAELISEAELERAKTRHIADLEFALDDPSEICGWYGSSALIGSPMSYEDRLNDVMTVTPARMMAVARRMFRTEAALLTLLGPVSFEQAEELEQRLMRPAGSTVWIDTEIVEVLEDAPSGPVDPADVIPIAG